MPTLYPATLDLSRRRALIVGGGRVALQKLRGLPLGCQVKVVSLGASSALRRALAKRGKEARLLRRAFRASDARGADLVFAATNSVVVNQAVARAARTSGAWVTVADAPATGDLQVPAVLSVAGLKLTLSTEGASPALAKALRKRFGIQLQNSNLGWVLRRLAAKRAWLKVRPALKRALLRELTRPITLDLLLGTTSAASRARLRRVLSPLSARV